MVITNRLTGSIALLRNLCSLRFIFLLKEKQVVTDMQIKDWNRAFEDFWSYKERSFYTFYNRVYTPFTTPINSVKLESAILYMVENIKREILVCNDAYKGIYTMEEMHKILLWHNKFYDRSNYKNYVHWDKLHVTFNHDNYVYLDKIPHLYTSTKKWYPASTSKWWYPSSVPRWYPSK